MKNNWKPVDLENNSLKNSSLISIPIYIRLKYKEIGDILQKGLSLIIQIIQI
jgi:hypothetical protein